MPLSGEELMRSQIVENLFSCCQLKWACMSKGGQAASEYLCEMNACADPGMPSWSAEQGAAVYSPKTQLDLLVLPTNAGNVGFKFGTGTDRLTCFKYDIT
ncbi:uncharacterized protein FRV6_13051 [Fusarium oxysporum]|uniref:Uncharacterized protein n=1 Tax=Fusarium oxysporum TaxID=5507 RepID=A0A2H3TJX0_FUSOX|nr:uncharacterized protein FRV6_13051 [Fusarium oxysporum]